MTKVAPEILDIFFGNFDTGNILTGNPLAGNDPKSQALFGNMMMELVGGENTNPENISGSFENNPENLLSETSNLTSQVGDELRVTAEGDDKLFARAQSVGKELFLMNNGKAVNDFLLYEPVKIDQGKYQVLESQIKGDNLSLILAGNENPNEIIKLDIPLELLSSADKNNNNGNSRISLLNNKGLSEEFSNLISKLNVKSIEIKQTDESAQITKDNLANLLPRKINLTLIGEDSGKTVVINSEIKRSDVKSFKKINGSSQNSELTDVKNGRVISTPITQITNSENNNLDSLLSGNKNQFNDSNLKLKIDAFDKSWSFESKENSEVGLTDKMTEAKSSGAEKLAIKSTRFTLPDDIKSQLSSQSKTVLIKLNPEHLGPAKLKLILRNNVLSAKILVDNVQVKAIVENSLDRLIDQLAKADIEVDKIEVSLDNGAAGERMFHQDQHWKKQFSNKFARENEEFSREIKSSEPIISRPIAQSYLSGAGVNILA